MPTALPKFRRFWPLVLLCAVLSAAVQADSVPTARPDPALARGFSPEQLFQGFAELDNVNHFNGNLVIPIPLGQEYPVGGSLSYQLSLAYNSQIWDIETVVNALGSWNKARPARFSNAGVGWALTFGQLFHPDDPANDALRGEWLYVSPDGASHRLYPTLHPDETYDHPGTRYSRDGSYLRSTEISSTVRTVEDNGITRTFECWANCSGISKWRLTRVEDAFGNFLSVSYSADGLTWTLTDSQNRTHEVLFEPVTGDDYYNSRLQEVRLEAFGGQTAVYTFQYLNAATRRGCPHNLANTGIFTSSYLDTIIRPDGSSFRFQYDFDTNAPEDACTVDGGRLQEMTLPTQGRVRWTYQRYLYPNEICELDSLVDCGPDCQWRRFVGVKERTLFEGPNDATGDTWHYRTELTGRDSGYPIVTETRCDLSKELVNTIETPEGNFIRSYFTVFYGGEDPDNVGWLREDYGLPFTRARSTFTTDNLEVFLSQEIFECDPDGAAPCAPERSVWVRYDDGGGGPCSSGAPDAECFDRNRRLMAQRTEYADGGKFRETVSNQFDGFGNYRRVVTRGDFVGNDRNRVTEVNYSPGRGLWPNQTMIQPSEPWLLGLRDEEKTTEGTEIRVAQLCMNATTGFLESRRILLGTSRGPADLLVAFEPDAAGNVAQERFYGGDGAGLPTAACAVPSGPAPFRQDHQYAGGVRSHTAWVDDECDDVLKVDLDLDVDTAIGRPSASRDSAGVVTTMAFDAMGRLTQVSPAEEAAVFYNYTVPTSAVDCRDSANQAQVSITSQSGVATLTESKIYFDCFGRVAREEERLPDGTWNQQTTTYTPTGLRATQTTIVAKGTANPPVTSFEDYDAFGRSGRVVAPDGFVTTFEYFGEHEVRSTVEIGTAPGVTTAVTRVEAFDHQGRLRRVTENSGLGGAATDTFYTYSIGGLEEVRIVGPVTQVRRTTRDGRGLVVSRQGPEIGASGNGTILFSNFDALGNPRSQSISGNAGFNLDFVFDKANRLVRIDAGGRPLKEYFFARSNSGLDKAAGKLVLAKRHNDLVDPATGQEIDVIVSERTEYAGRGGRVSRRIVSANRSFLQPGSAIAFETSFFYDVLGQPDTLIYPTCLHSCGTPPSRTVFFDYGRGRLTSVVGYASLISYHPNGMLAGVEHTNGASYAIANDPSSMRRPQSITLTDSNGVPATLGPFAYDGASNMTASGPEFYVFDDVSRLVEATFGSGSGQTYAFDAFGNLTSITTTTGGMPSTRTIGVSASTNRLTSAVYDAAGNVTSWNGNSYQFDAVSMMTSWNGEKHFVYDADDMRVMLYDSAAGEERWRLRGLGQEVLRENVRSAAGWQWSRDYVFRDGEMLASISAENGTRHQHPNHLGTPRVITDESGLIVASQLLRPFGEEASGKEAETGFLKFTGHERDFNGSSAANHLDYMRARFYSPHLGRFLSPDRVSGSAEIPQSWNRYAYARNNPISFVDPDGEFALGAAVKVVKVAIKGGDLAATVAGIAADARTVVNSEASFGERALAAVSIASEFISPVSLKEAKGISQSIGATSDLPTGGLGQRLADRAQLLPSSQRPNTVAVMKTRDGQIVVGRNRGGVENPGAQAVLERIPPNEFGGACAEINCVSRALDKGLDVRGATIEVVNVRGASSTTGVHGTPKPACSVCRQFLDFFGIKQ